MVCLYQGRESNEVDTRIVATILGILARIDQFAASACPDEPLSTKRSCSEFETEIRSMPSNINKYPSGRNPSYCDTFYVGDNKLGGNCNGISHY